MSLFTTQEKELTRLSWHVLKVPQRFVPNEPSDKPTF